ncbi:MAG: glycosyltransferase family 2 protein [Chitinispirillaceae bacterium]|jgi:glycosyltransferase involved in cell wall biosynthesis|nr:glycosyltransferase family 2 protein [Chitinispirillaceae bacterium]
MNLTPDLWPLGIHLCIPSYQSGDLLEKFLPRLLAIVPKTHVCVVDDGSSDKTVEVCGSLAIKCLSHAGNRGKGAALVTGFDYLIGKGASAVITLDADGQHAPDDLASFLSEFTAHPDTGIITGCRSMRIGTMPAMRIFSNRLTSLLLSCMTGTSIPDSQCGYRLYSSKLLKAIRTENPGFAMESEVLLKAAHAGFPVRCVRVQTLYLGGTSHISHLADTLRWIRTVFRCYLTLKNKKK